MFDDMLTHTLICILMDDTRFMKSIHDIARNSGLSNFN